MLVLTRKTNEEIIIGDDIRITVVEIAPGRVKIGIAAPKSVRVDRAEVHEKKKQEETKKAESAVEPAPVPVVVNRLADVLPAVTEQPAVVAGPAEHPLPANRISELRRRFPKKPR